MIQPRPSNFTSYTVHECVYVGHFFDLPMETVVTRCGVTVGQWLAQLNDDRVHMHQEPQYVTCRECIAKLNEESPILAPYWAEQRQRAREKQAN